MSLAASTALLAAVLTGCIGSGDRRRADVTAASAPDTLHAGEPLTLTVNWWHSCCTQFEPEFRVVNDSTVTFTVWITSESERCLCPAVFDSSEFTLQNPPQRTFVVRVLGESKTIELTIHHAG